MEKGDKFTHEGIEYTAITIFDNGEVEGFAEVHVGEVGSSPCVKKRITILEGDITP